MSLAVPDPNLGRGPAAAVVGIGVGGANATVGNALQNLVNRLFTDGGGLASGGKPEVNLLYSLVWSPVATAVFTYLMTRIASYVWGVPPLNPRVLRALELDHPLRRLAHPVLSLALWVLAAILVASEWAIATKLLEAISVGDSAIAVILGAHFPVAVAWVLYLRARYVARWRRR